MPLVVPTTNEFETLRRDVRRTERCAFAAVEEQVQFVVDALNEWRPRRKLSKYDWALLLHLGRATYTVMHGIVPVCEAMGGDLAMMLVRSLYETMISAYWMSIDRDARADAFDRFATIETRDLHLLLVDLGVIETRELHRMEPAQEVALRAEFPKTALGWTKQKLWALERDVKAMWPASSREEFRLYAKAAREIGNRHTHISPGETLARLVAAKGRGEVTIGPTRRAQESVRIALKIAGWCYGQLVDLVVEHTKLADLGRARAYFRRAMLRTRALTQDELRGVRARDRCPCGSRWKFGRCHGERALV